MSILLRKLFSSSKLIRIVTPLLASIPAGTSFTQTPSIVPPFSSNKYYHTLHCISLPQRVTTQRGNMEGHTLRRSKRLSSQNAAIEDSNEAPTKKTKTRKVMKKVLPKNKEQVVVQEELKTVKKVVKRKVSKRKVSKIQDTKTEKQNTISTTTFNTDHLLLDLGTLVKGTLVKRPSATIKSPYVSDVKIVDEDGNEKIVLAHSPALDVGGLCSVGTTVLMSTREGGKTSHAIELLLTDDANGESNVLVGAHPQR